MQFSAHEWNSCDDPEVMIDFLNERGNVSPLKFRQFSLACCRQVEELLPSEAFLTAISQIEQFATGKLPEEDRILVHENIWRSLKSLPEFDSFNLGETENYSYSAALVVLFAIWRDPRKNHGNANGALYVISHTIKALAGHRGISQIDEPQQWEEEALVEKRSLAELVREIFEFPATTT